MSTKQPILPALCLLLAFSTITILAMPPLAMAEDPGRAQYAAEAEPICHASTVANAHILKGVRGEVKRSEFGKAGSRVARAARAFNETVATIADLPRPPADAARLERWLGYLEDEGDFLTKMATALKAEEKYKAESYSVKLTSTYPRANNVVLEFPFHYCQIDPARFT